MNRYAIVALFTPLDLGATISRREWPAHVTLASNFTTVASTEEIIGVVDTDTLAEPLDIRIGKYELFGPNHDVPVRLVDSTRSVTVHGHLAKRLEALPAFAPEEPAYWRSGYRPHLTLGPLVAPVEGNREVASHIAVVEILESNAKVLAIFEAQGAH